MIAASAPFLAEEAKPLTAKPVVWVTFFPRQHRTGVGEGGEFAECFFVAPAEIQANYHGFALGYYISPQMAAGLGRYPSPATLGADWNSPGFTRVLSFRTARTLALLDILPWTPFALGDELQLEAFYQWKVEYAGYRSWAEDDAGDADAFTAYAVDDPEDPADADYLSYAADENHYGDVQTYLRDVELVGQFPVAADDVESGGRVTHQKPEKFDEIVAGDHSGLTVNDRQGLFSPQRSTFIFAREPDWRQTGKEVLLEIGYLPPAAQTPEMIPIYRGRVKDWGPLGRAVDQGGLLQPHTVEVYTRNGIAALLEHKVGYPDAGGRKRPKIMGEVLAKAEKVSGQALAAPLRVANFEDNNFNEVDGRIEVGGGSLSLVTADPLEGNISLQVATTGANQAGQVKINLAAPLGEVRCKFSWKLVSMPAAPVNGNAKFLVLQDAAGAEIVSLSAHSDFKMRVGAEASNWDLRTYEGVEVEAILWLKTGSPGNLKFWVNGDEVYSATPNLGSQTARVLFGLAAGGAAESWTALYDALEVGDKYHDQAYQVPGWPFLEIKTVYVDKIARPDAYIEKFPEIGAVNFLPDPGRPDEKDVSGEVQIRLVADSLGHPADQIQELVEECPGGAAILNTASVAAAKAATPDYVVGTQIEEMTAAEAIAEICSHCLFWVFDDHGEIVLQAYTSAALPAPALTLDRDELREISPTTPVETAPQRVVVPYGWNERNPGLQEAAGPADGEPEKIDLTWGSKVATDSRTMAAQIAARYYARLRTKDTYDPVRFSLRGARLQMTDSVRLVDPFQADAPQDCEIGRKEINLDPPRETGLQLFHYLET